MFKRKKKKTGVQTPEFISKVSMPPVKPPKPPTSGSNAQKPPNVGSSVQHSKQFCPYETPCGWCTKWDKKCDQKIGCGDDNKSQRGLRAQGDAHDDDCPIPEKVIRKIIKDVVDFEESMRLINEVEKENNNEII